jgi:hypothetical protein
MIGIGRVQPGIILTAQRQYFIKHYGQNGTHHNSHKGCTGGGALPEKAQQEYGENDRRYITGVFLNKFKTTPVADTQQSLSS